MAKFVEEFLVRGRADGSVTWHVCLGESEPDTFGRPVPATHPLSPSAATAAGFPLPIILNGINTAALAHVEALTAHIASLDSHALEIMSLLPKDVQASERPAMKPAALVSIASASAAISTFAAAKRKWWARLLPWKWFL